MFESVRSTLEMSRRDRMSRLKVRVHTVSMNGTAEGELIGLAVGCSLASDSRALRALFHLASACSTVFTNVVGGGTNVHSRRAHKTPGSD